MRTRRFLVLCACVVTSWRALFAQARTPVGASCDGRTISEISIIARDPSFLSVPRGLRALARGAGLLHTTTQPRVIAGFLLLEPGARCTERNRAESERILRLQPFIADASVRAVPDTNGTVRIEVETIDEIPTVFAMRNRGIRPTAVRFGNGNVAGQGLYLAASVEHRPAYRAGVGIRAVAYQAFGRPYTLSLDAERAPLGGSTAVGLGYPFFTALQRSAWHAGFSDATRYDAFLRPDADALSLAVDRRFWDLGAVRRVVVAGQDAFVGLLASHEAVVPRSRVVIASDSGIVPDTTRLLGKIFPAYRNVRLGGVVGVRSLSFVPARGFDALNAVQDVAIGLQFGALAAHGMSQFGGGDDDFLVSTDVYGGMGSASSFAGVRIEGEARYDRATSAWDSRVASGRVAWYVKPSAAHVLIASAEFGAGRQQRTPFQLALGEPDGGVRGFFGSREAGASRAVARLEERWMIPLRTQRSAVGVATFADAGRVWAGDAPFGVNSRIRMGVGVGLIAAVPPQSPHQLRLDFAVPVNRDPHSRYEVRLSSAWARTFWREPGDVSRGRAGAAPSTIFGWP